MNAVAYYALAAVAYALVQRERLFVECRIIRLRRVDQLLKAGRGREARRVMARLHAEYDARRERMPGWYGSKSEIISDLPEPISANLADLPAA